MQQLARGVQRRLPFHMAMASSATFSTAAPPRVAVVGGGVAGLAAAQALAKASVAVTLLDMGGRSVGGRVASRQLSHQGQELSFDHGAQLITAIGQDFRQQVVEWQAAGVLAEWRGRHGAVTGAGRFKLGPSAPPPPGSGAGTGFCGSLTGLPLYVGTPTNNALCQHLAEQLAVQPGAQLLRGVAVQSAAKVGGGCGSSCGSARWQLRGSRRGRAAAAAPAEPAEQEDLGTFDALVLADAMPFLPGSAGHIAGLEGVSTSLAQLARSVQAAAPAPCFALIVAFEQPLQGVPFDSAWVDPSSSSSGSSSSGPAFQFVACNSSKPGRPQPDGGSALQCWVALTTPQRARQLLEARPLSVGGRFNPQTQQYQADAAAELLADFRALMQPFVQGELPAPAYCHSQRWGRGFVAEPLGTEFLFLPAQRLALCGDVAAGSSVEAAWRSGRAAGSAVASMLRSAGASQ